MSVIAYTGCGHVRWIVLVSPSNSEVRGGRLQKHKWSGKMTMDSTYVTSMLSTDVKQNHLHVLSQSSRLRIS